MAASNAYTEITSKDEEPMKSGKAFIEDLSKMKPNELDESSLHCRKAGVDRKRGLRILVIDGGGSKGLIATVVLKCLEDKLKERLQQKGIKIKKIHLADHFDLIAGTSAGGMISIGHGHCRLSLDDIEKVFLSGEVFSTNYGMMSKIYGFMTGAEMYSGDKVQEMLKAALDKKPFGVGEPGSGLINLNELDIVKKTELKDLTYDASRMDGGLFGLKMRMLELSDKVSAPEIKFPRVFAITNLDDTNEVHLLTNYTPEEYSSWIAKKFAQRALNYCHSNVTPWEAGRATSAAPGYFKSQKMMTEKKEYDKENKAEKIVKEKQAFWDGGIVNNSPISQAITEACFLFGEKRKIDLVVSVGTGIAAKPKKKENESNKRKLMNKIMNSVANQEKEYQQAEEQLSINPQMRETVRDKLFRLNVANVAIGMDESNREELKKAKIAAQEWCNSKDNAPLLERIVNFIIESTFGEEDDEGNASTSQTEEPTNLISWMKVALEKCSQLTSSLSDIDKFYHWKEMKDDERHCDWIDEGQEIKYWKSHYEQNIKPIHDCLMKITVELPGYIDDNDDDSEWLRELASTTTGWAHHVETLRYSLTKSFLYPLIYRIDRMNNQNDQEKGMMLKEIFPHSKEFCSFLRILILMDRNNALQSMRLQMPKAAKYPKGFQWISEEDFKEVVLKFNNKVGYENNGAKYLMNEVLGKDDYTIENAFMMVVKWLEKDFSDEAKIIKMLLLPELPKWMKDEKKVPCNHEDFKIIVEKVAEIRNKKIGEMNDVKAQTS